jgi:hypothetical protein
VSEYVDLLVQIDATCTSVWPDDEPYKQQHRLTPECLRELNELERREGDPVAYGRRLFEATFVGRAHEGFRRGVGIGGGQNRLLRLQLEVDGPELHALRWECLVDSENRSSVLLGRASYTTISRRVPIRHRPDYELGRDVGPRVLVAVPDPLGHINDSLLPRLDAQAEWQALIGDGPQREAGNELLAPPASLRAIRNRLSEGFQVLHLVAHWDVDPTGEPYLLMEQESSPEPYKAYREKLIDLISRTRSLRLLVLVTCYSRIRSAPELQTLAQSLIEAGDLSAVVLLRDGLRKEEAQAFVAAFYEQLHHERSGLVDVAVNEARLRISESSDRRWTWSSPILLTSGDMLLEHFLRQEQDWTIPVQAQESDQYRVVAPGRPRVAQISRISRRTTEHDLHRVRARSRMRDQDYMQHTSRSLFRLRAG